MSTIVRAVISSIGVEGESFDPATTGLISINAGVLTLDLTARSRVFYVNNNANITSVDIVNAPADVVSMITVIMTNDGNTYTQNWTAGTTVLWQNDQPPEFTPIADSVDIWSAMIDRSTNYWFGFLNSQNFTLP